MLKPEDFISKGYRKIELTSFQKKESLADYLLCKAITDESGKKYSIAVYVYEHYKENYYNPEIMHAYSYQPDVQFREGKHPTINTQLIIDSNTTIQEIEDTFEVLFVASGACYYEYYWS
mgnify:CR=1 FL=1